MTKLGKAGALNITLQEDGLPLPAVTSVLKMSVNV
jgi:hypothetical protein